MKALVSRLLVKYAVPNRTTLAMHREEPGRNIALSNAIARGRELRAATTRLLDDARRDLLVVANVTTEAVSQGEAEEIHARALSALHARIEELSETNRMLVDMNEELTRVNRALLEANQRLRASSQDVELVSGEIERMNRDLETSNADLHRLTEQRRSARRADAARAQSARSEASAQTPRPPTGESGASRRSNRPN